MGNKAVPQEIDILLHLWLMPIPLKWRSKHPLVRWVDKLNPSRAEVKRWFADRKVNTGMRCGEKLAVIDCDSEGAYLNFIATHDLPSGCLGACLSNAHLKLCGEWAPMSQETMRS